jgi:DNA-binding transcriptional MerR regulator
MTASAAQPSELASPAVVRRSLPIAEVAERTGLSKDTLRYYEKAGLIEAVDRSSGGQRRYAAADLDWLAFLLRLRATGMSIADMQRFAQLRKQGEASIADRLALLSRHHDDVTQQIAALHGHLQALDTKIDHYEEQLDKRTGMDIE